MRVCVSYQKVASPPPPVKTPAEASAPVALFLSSLPPAPLTMSASLFPCAAVYVESTTVYTWLYFL